MDVHRGADGTLSTDFALELRDVHVRYGDVRALDGVTFRARPRAVHALLGENGAGKTTLMRVAYGMQRPDIGTVTIAGIPALLDSPADAIRRGIGMVHQHFTLVPAMTVAENVALGGRAFETAADDAARYGQRPRWWYDARRTAEGVRALATSTGLHLEPHARVGSLGVSAQQRVEIVKALARDARILILDEPSAVLPPPDAAELMRRLRQMADEGRTIVLITHKLREALEIADDVTVLRRGRTVLEGGARESSPDGLAAAMLGEPSTGGETVAVVTDSGAVDAPSSIALTSSSVPIASARALAIEDERGVPRIRNATFDVRPREIVGVAAVEGSGHRELLRALAGRLVPTSGSLRIPPDVGFIPEDRHRDALALDFTLTENIALRGAGARRGLTRWRYIARRTQALLDAFDVRASSERIAARELSGGNQQKLVLARELEGDPGLLVAENPTRGLDVRSTAAMHRRLRQARDAGMAIIFHSNDVDETLALADRMLVVFDGMVHEVARDRETVGAAMVGLR